VNDKLKKKGSRRGLVEVYKAIFPTGTKENHGRRKSADDVPFEIRTRILPNTNTFSEIQLHSARSKVFFLVKTQCSYENGYSIYIGRPIGTCVHMRIEENR
jgi:hypothetical protein